MFDLTSSGKMRKMSPHHPPSGVWSQGILHKLAHDMVWFSLMESKQVVIHDLREGMYLQDFFSVATQNSSLLLRAPQHLQWIKIPAVVMVLHSSYLPVCRSHIGRHLRRPAQQDGAEEWVLWNLREKVNIKQDTETFILSKGGNQGT